MKNEQIQIDQFIIRTNKVSVHISYNATYSASEEDSVWLLCALDFHEIRNPLTYMQYPVTLNLLYLSPA